MKSNFSPFPILESKRLKLRKLATKDESALYEYQSNKENFLYVDMPIYKSIEDAKNYIYKMNSGVEQNKWVIWAICHRLTDEIIGTVSIWNLDNELNKAEFGYGIFPAFRRQGYMKEALTVVIKYALTEMELSIIEAYTNHNNKESIEFLKNMQFAYIKTIEDEYSNGALMDVFAFSVYG